MGDGKLQIVDFKAAISDDIIDLHHGLSVGVDKLLDSGNSHCIDHLALKIFFTGGFVSENQLKLACEFEFFELSF
ncbi:hypothetical protein D3C87_1893150 [compost metagenome]